MPPFSRRTLLIAVLPVPLTMAYRFITLDGPLAGFTNDDFVHLARAQQIVLGELPVRDFPEVGMPLTEALSAAAQGLGGQRLLSEFVLAAGLLGVAGTLLLLLARRASASLAVALAIVGLQVLLEPRFYNYPKLLAYAAGIPVIWAYVDRPTLARAVMLGAAVALAFLLRHDHGAYLGAAAAVAVIAVHAPRAGQIVRRGVQLAAVVAAVLLPYLVFVEVHGGVVTYFRSALAVADTDATRTARPPQRLQVDWSAPLVGLAPPPATRINVRWSGSLSEAMRAAREQAHGLRRQAQPDTHVFTYDVADASPANLARIVRDPLVEDTYGIDRERFTVNHPDYDGAPPALARLRILPGVLHRANAVPFLFFLFTAIPLASLALLAWRWRVVEDPLGAGWRAKVLAVVALALLVNDGFLRGALASRLPDVTVPVGVLAAWLAGWALARRGRASRVAAGGAAVLVALLVFASAGALRNLTQRFSLDGLTARVEQTWMRLRAVPPAASYDSTHPGAVRVAQYLAACVAPGERVVVLAYAPELLVLSGRGFAGGHPSIRPGFFTSEPDQRQTIARIDAARAPVAVTVPAAEWRQDYERQFPQLAGYMNATYQEVGTADLLDGSVYRVLARRDVQPVATYDELSLPCYR